MNRWTIKTTCRRKSNIFI